LVQVSARGLRGGYRDGNASAFGETLNDTGAATTLGGSSGRSGGSYGGLGQAHTGQPTAVYGDEMAPAAPGAGGGSTNSAYPGGNGGGMARLNVGSIVLNGQILADGGNGSAYAGGGAGGAIHVNVAGGTVSGTGLVRARGGAGSLSSGDGGGGRIALTGFSSSTYTGGMMAAGGGSTESAAGTVFVKRSTQPAGELILDNNAVVTNAATPIRNQYDVLTVRNGAALRVANTVSATSLAVRTSGSLLIESTGKLTVTGDFTLANLGSKLTNLGELTVPTFSNTNVTVASTASTPRIVVVNRGRLVVVSDVMEIGRGVELTEDGDLRGGTRGADTIGAFTLMSGGYLNHSPRSADGLRFTVANTLDIQSGGIVDVSSRGLRGAYRDGSTVSEGERPSGSSATTAGGATGRSGASHGGAGQAVAGTSNATYGDLRDPTALGSGGASTDNRYPGGNGGGRVDLSAGTMLVNGQILADGGIGSYYGGAGSGGSIRLRL
ncbi:MAG: hypothetical protein ACK4N5_19665, partial [Myxococcales bacterium]